jgi:hypothetical protein
MGRPFPRFLGETQLREHARHPRMACAKQSQRSAKNLVWKNERHGDEIKEAVRLARYVEPSNSRVTDDYVELKRTDGSATVLRIVWRMLPRNGGRSLLLVCSYCNAPRRHVYGWEWDRLSGWSNRVRQISWRCRSCARLRCSSEGGYLRGSGRGALGAMFRAAFGNLPRPELWLPYVFTSIDDPHLDQIVRRIV